MMGNKTIAAAETPDSDFSDYCGPSAAGGRDCADSLSGGRSAWRISCVCATVRAIQGGPMMLVSASTPPPSQGSVLAETGRYTAGGESS